MFNSEFSYMEVSFANQNCNPLVIEDEINITLFINYSIACKMTRYSVQPRDRIFAKGYGFFVFC